jgi:TRAP-type C4-dicarboxylate transport system substrate-binding protein
MIGTLLRMLFVSVVAMTLSLQARSESLDLYWGGEPKDPRVQFLDEMQSAITRYSHDTLSVRTHIDSGNIKFNLDPLAVLRPEQTSVAIFPSTLLSRIVPQFLIFDLPYLIRDHSHAMRVADQLTPLRSRSGNI